MPGRGSRAARRCSRRSPASTCRPPEPSQELRGLRHECVPLLWCSAQPSGRVTRDAYERITAMLLEDLERERRRGSTASTSICTARWLPSTSTMRTASCCSSCARASGRACRSSRASTITRTSHRRWPMRRRALVAYRTYPHVDMAESGGRAARCLHDSARADRRRSMSLQPIDFLVALTSQSTLVEPMRSLDAAGGRRRAQPRCARSRSRPAFRRPMWPNAARRSIACGDESGVAARWTRSRRPCRRRARPTSCSTCSRSTPPCGGADARSVAERGRPVILADTQDNPGAGGNADTTDLLRRCSRSGPSACSLGLICDPDAAARGTRGRCGRDRELDLGAGSRGCAGRRAACTRVYGVEARRRPLYRHGPVLSRRAHRTRADGAAARPTTSGVAGRVAASSRPRTRRCSATSASSRRMSGSWRSRARSISAPTSARRRPRAGRRRPGTQRRGSVLRIAVHPTCGQASG